MARQQVVLEALPFLEQPDWLPRQALEWLHQAFRWLQHSAPHWEMRSATIRLRESTQEQALPPLLD